MRSTSFRAAFHPVRFFKSTMSTVNVNNDELQHANDLTVPAHVRGMRVLDRDRFTKEIKVHCYFFENNRGTKAMKFLKPYLLKINSFNPVRVGHEPCCRVAYLDPIKVSNGFEDFAVQVRRQMIELGFTDQTCVRNLTLTYDNFKADEILRAVIPSELEAVTSYSVIGHIVHLNLRSELEEYKSVIGSVLLDKVSNARTVVTKTDSIDSTFRCFNMEVIAGVPEFETSVRENKCTYSMDFSKVYWNPRLSGEHQRVASTLKRGDVLFDVFCGVGPFVIPCAKKGVRCFANDLNPTAVDYLEANIRANNVSLTTVSVWCLDGEKFVKDVVKRTLLDLAAGDFRIIVTMNLPALAPTFFRAFKGLFTPEEFSRLVAPPPIVRVYCFVKCPESRNQIEAKNLVESSVEMDLSDEILHVDFVRNVAPNKDMMVVLVRLTDRILVNNKRPSCEEPDDADAKKLCYDVQTDR